MHFLNLPFLLYYMMFRNVAKWQMLPSHASK